MSNISDSEIRISGIITESIVDGPGIRFVLFTQGCKKRCYGCHNEATQDLNGGMIEQLDDIVKLWRKNPMLQGITISGGEPFLQPDKVLYLAKKAKETGLDVVVYSGYYYDELKGFENESIDELLETADYLIDGPFQYRNKNLEILFRGSSNQRIVDLGKTKLHGSLVLLNDEEWTRPQQNIKKEGNNYGYQQIKY